MERQYYVERDHETSETSDRLEAARIAAEWVKRGYKVETVVVNVTNDSVQLADNNEVIPTPDRARRDLRRRAVLPRPVARVTGHLWREHVETETPARGRGSSRHEQLTLSSICVVGSGRDRRSRG